MERRVLVQSTHLAAQENKCWPNKPMALQTEFCISSISAFLVQLFCQSFWCSLAFPEDLY